MRTPESIERIESPFVTYRDVYIGKIEKNIDSYIPDGMYDGQEIVIWVNDIMPPEFGKQLSHISIYYEFLNILIEKYKNAGWSIFKSGNKMSNYMYFSLSKEKLK